MPDPVKLSAHYFGYEVESPDDGGFYVEIFDFIGRDAGTTEVFQAPGDAWKAARKMAKQLDGSYHRKFSG